MGDAALADHPLGCDGVARQHGEDAGRLQSRHPHSVSDDPMRRETRISDQGQFSLPRNAALQDEAQGALPIRQRIPTAREVLRDWKTERRRHVTAIRLLIYTGARKAEIEGLRWEWIGPDFVDPPDGRTGPKRIYLDCQANAVFDELGREAAGLVFEGVAQNPCGEWRKIRVAAELMTFGFTISGIASPRSRSCTVSHWPRVASLEPCVEACLVC